MTRHKKRLMPNQRSHKTGLPNARDLTTDFNETSNNQNIRLETFQLTSRLQQRNEEWTHPLVKMIRINWYTRLDLKWTVSWVSKARFIRRISVVWNAIETIDNEMICFIIFCLNCIRHGRYTTYEPGLSHLGSHHIGKWMNILDGKIPAKKLPSYNVITVHAKLLQWDYLYICTALRISKTLPVWQRFIV